MKSREYFRFIVSRIESDLRIYPGTGELLKCMYLLGVLKSSENLLRDIYTISHIKNFKNLGNYLIFILKKTENGEVRFDNFLENLNLDREYLEKELTNIFNLDSSHKKDKTKPKKEKAKEDKISTEIKRILAESKFKVEKIDNELVDEEFSETDTIESGEFIVRGNYLELLQPESELDEASVFSLPTDKNLHETEDEVPFEENDVFSLPSVSTSKDEAALENPVEEVVNTDEIDEVKLDKIEEAAATAASIAEEVSGELKEEELIPQEIPEEREEINEYENIISEEATEEEISETIEKAEENIKKEETEIPGDAEEHETKETEVEPATEENEAYESVEIAEAENSVYMKYETELLTSNVLLQNNLGELAEINPETENYSDKKNLLIKEIVDSCSYMEEYSKKMSFEVITGIYGVMNMTFSIYGKTVGKEIIALFRDSIKLIESLIKGEDFAGYDSVMKSLDVLKRTLMDARGEETKVEKTIIEESEPPEQVTPAKEYDTNERQKLAIIKQNITEVENVFKSIEDIKGKYQAYEALRRLSHTFAHFKELVTLANSLDLRKLAQLAEASYIFVKFIQNYRMDPFEAEISEVFKYIIYNFKLIFLDKPTKDIDLLISYLNDPVKIFEKKEKT